MALSFILRTNVWRLVVAIGICGLAAITSAGQLERVGEDVEVPSVTTEELVSAIDGDETLVVVDVRLEEDFAADPVLIPAADWKNPHAIEEWADGLAPETRVVVYCVKGKWVSRSVTSKLREMGFDVSQLTGGIEAWKSAGEPTKPADSR